MKRVRTFLSNLLEKTARNEKKWNSESYITLAKAEVGQSFKGHAFNITFQKDTSCDEKGSFIRHNRYYGGAVNETYSIDNNKTSINYHIYGPSPKWLVKKQIDIIDHAREGNVFIGQQLKMADPSIIIGDNPKIMLYSNSYTIEYKQEIDGVHFSGHRENIDELRELNFFHSEVRDKIKHTEIENIVKDIEDLTIVPLNINQNVLL
tara:strand:+ start:2470 stop:3087 length:618 start_codon:yes stop_codon:yes gene_type:complete